MSKIDLLVGFLCLALLGCVAFISYATGYVNIVEDCNKNGYFKYGHEIYQCKLRGT